MLVVHIRDRITPGCRSLNRNLVMVQAESDAAITLQAAGKTIKKEKPIHLMDTDLFCMRTSGSMLGTIIPATPATRQQEVLDQINQAQSEASKRLKEADWLVIITPALPTCMCSSENSRIVGNRS